MAEHLVHNERVKLQATALNNTAIAMFVSGVIQTALEASRLSAEINVPSAAVGLSLWGFAAFFHRCAFTLLSRPKEKEVETAT